MRDVLLAGIYGLAFVWAAQLTWLWLVVRREIRAYRRERLEQAATPREPFERDAMLPAKGAQSVVIRVERGRWRGRENDPPSPPTGAAS